MILCSNCRVVRPGLPVSLEEGVCHICGKRVVLAALLNIYEDDSTWNFVRFRQVLNDVCVSPWEDMPEIQPATLLGLVNYIKTCPGEDYTKLSYQYGGRDPHLIGWGLRRQFWLPNIPKPEDFVWLNNAWDEGSNKDNWTLPRYVNPPRKIFREKVV